MLVSSLFFQLFFKVITGLKFYISLSCSLSSCTLQITSRKYPNVTAALLVLVLAPFLSGFYYLRC